MNRFFDIDGIISKELMPWESKRRGLSVTTGLFELQVSFQIRSDIFGGIIECEKGEISDLASIPLWVQGMVMALDDQRISGGAWPHDKLYKAGGWVLVLKDDGSRVWLKATRKQCDQFLCDECMPDLGASKLDRWKVYSGLRLGGRSSFKTSFIPPQHPAK